VRDGRELAGDHKDVQQETNGLPAREQEDKMPETPTLFVCHGDDGGPRIHPCRRVQEALRAAGIEYDKVIAGHGSPIPFLRKGSRDELRDATGATKLPALKLPDGTVITQSRAILSWIGQQK
jgi:Glutathione S-transferase, N-terminal domain